MPRWRRLTTVGRVLFELGLAIVALGLASDWRSPLLSDHRTATLAALLVIPATLVGAEAWLLRQPQPLLLRLARFSVIAVAAAALTITAALEGRFWWTRTLVFAAEPERLARLGRHFIVGYRDPGEIDALVERRAIAGIFVGTRNVDAGQAAAIAQQIAAWQNIRRSQGLPPLWVATDQEGGAVSRLSPPLPYQPPIATTALEGPDVRHTAAYAYGVSQGRGLASLGINLNFAPVVDLDFGLRNPNDRYTRIHQRAISNDPNIVAEIAGSYCDGLATAAVRCTLKHFPGIGRVYGDTHVGAAELDTPITELRARDWIPFRALMASAGFMMMSHARLVAVDPARPASLSHAVIAGLLRGDWGYEGILVTDDFGMRAIYSGPAGLPEAGVDAINAGIDLLLVSYDPDQYFAIMNGLLQAEREGRLSAERIAASERRLAVAAMAPPNRTATDR